MTAAHVANDPNQHVSEYLAYYIGFKQTPRYAVMLNGKWGAGKTFQVKKIVGELLASQSLPDKKRYVLVSLYGLKTPQEIDDAMVAALYPWTDNDGVRIAASVGRAILKHAKIDIPELKSGDLINRMSADVFIFDDLERCTMPVTTALGYINQLVERDGCKVIVLANEEEIFKKDNEDKYRLGKEKLIGKTLEVEPDFNSAFNEFLKEITDQNAKHLYELKQTGIEQIYDQSTLKNLRILQQTLWDFERVYKLVDEKHRANTDAMDHLLRHFLALSFELKAGNISSDDLKVRSQIEWSDLFSKDENPAPLSVAQKKYPRLMSHGSILSDEVVFDILVRGVVDGDAIRQSLDASSWFVSADEPAWRTVWHATERPDETVEAAAIRMMKEFKDRHYVSVGEILHLFGLMLKLADIGVSVYNRIQTVAECKSYVDDLRQQGKLESPAEALHDSIRFGSFDHLGFWQSDTPEFQELCSYVATQRILAETDRFPEQAKSLLELLEHDPDNFVQQITFPKDDIATFANKPVLANADPGIFAERMIALEPLAFREVLFGFSIRYDMAKLAEARELSSEREWAENLVAALLEKADKLKPIPKDRISSVVERTLGRTLKELR
jgi:KAP family P-loop domain